MPKTEPAPVYDTGTFAGRKAEREAREAAEGKREPRLVTLRAGYNAEPTDLMAVTHVQA